MHTGKKIKLFRNLKGISQEQLAEKIGRTRALVSHIEQTSKVNYDTLMLILNYFNLTKQEFDDFEQSQFKINKIKEYKLTEQSINQLQEKLENYQKENTILKELIESQKEMIVILKKKVGRK
jgi:transcriptional regulator with XRE-family HTH domain